MRRAALLILPALLGSCIATAKQDLQEVSGGEWRLEADHASLVWRVKHMGLSNYTARFTKIDASLDFDPQDPSAARLRAAIDPMSVRTEHPDGPAWDERLAGDFFRAGDYPQIVFISTAVETTGEFTGKVTGDLTFLGVTEPVTLDVVFNGAVSNSPVYQFRDVVGFSAHGTLSRSAFGLTRYASIASDDVEIIIEMEFSRAT